MDISIPQVSEPRSQNAEPSARVARSFFREILRSPWKVGAICPSSRFLGRSMARGCGVAAASSIIELGGGGGAITREILRLKSPASPLLVMEKNPSLAESLRSQFPDATVVEACCRQLPSTCRDFGLHRADCILSTLPWSLFSEEMQHEVLESIRNHLAPGGQFATAVTFGPHFLPAGTRLRANLLQYFRKVRRSPIHWANFPPALVYYCSV